MHFLFRISLIFGLKEKGLIINARYNELSFAAHFGEISFFFAFKTIQ